MKFKKVIKYSRFEATIYDKSENYHRVAAVPPEKRHLVISSYSDAKTKAKRIVRD